jgi:Na+-transporting methylmalonyl-CoA/oxaloacetate decarboxylase gamma subunit
VAQYGSHKLTDRQQMGFVLIVLPLLALSTIGLMGSVLAQSLRSARRANQREPLTDGQPVEISVHLPRSRP